MFVSILSRLYLKVKVIAIRDFLCYSSYMSIKTFLVKKMLKSKGVPDEQIDMVMEIMDKDPDLFKKIQEEIKAETKKGMNEQMASLLIMKKYQSQLQNLLKK